MREERHLHGVPAVRPRIEAVWFGGANFARMAKVFEATARQHCPGWDLNVRQIEEVEIDRHRSAGKGHVANTQKLEEWNAVVQAAPAGARLLLIDADTFFTNPIDDIWDQDFDIAYTTRYADLPFNLGVMFLRVSDPVRAIFADFAKINREMLTDEAAHDLYRHRFGGMNQSAFGRLLETEAARALNIVTLPCREWNCEDSAWSTFDPSLTRIVHVKSALRRALFDGTPAAFRKPGVASLVSLWRKLEETALEPV